ncbi:MAG TPA: lipoprotein-releasing ABC transporter permease subunit [Gammaproteobacteria bacterium]|nr:lipoprotein-releasing ABC transporter permease subunit [Gammaproteobacteria bacterium]
MLKPLELYIGLRYTRAGRNNHFISFISFISMFGILLGVWALITVSSTMNGFEGELRSRILGVTAHVTVTGSNGWVRDWKALQPFIKAEPGVVAFAPYILGQGMVSSHGRVTGALIRGIDPQMESRVDEVANKMVNGRLQDLKAGAFGMVLGSELAWKLGLTVGSKATLIAPQGLVTPAGMIPRLRRFTVVGIFHAGMYEYDSSLVFIHSADAARLYRTRGQVSGIRLKLNDVYQAPQVRKSLAAKLGKGYRVSDWTLENANFFRALKIEKRVMSIIIILIVAVAAFNIVSSLVMTVTDKAADIAILRTLGMKPGSIMVVFVIQGAIVGVIGTLLGAALGVLTAVNLETLVPWLENLFGVEFFPADVYVISGFPAELQWQDVINTITISLVLSLLATLYPAWRAARTQPAEALRYE